LNCTGQFCSKYIEMGKRVGAGEDGMHIFLKGVHICRITIVEMFSCLCECYNLPGEINMFQSERKLKLSLEIMIVMAYSCKHL